MFRPLTIVSQPMEQIGIQAARLMLERLSGDGSATPMTVTLSATLREGASIQTRRQSGQLTQNKRSLPDDSDGDLFLFDYSDYAFS